MGRLGRVGPYTLVDRLGRGGMGEVYLATARRGEKAALKMLHDTVDADSEAGIRLEREVRALRRVESPYVARVLDADLEGDRPYLVMEYIEGDTLLDRVRRDGPLEGADLIGLAHGLATALAIIHAAGVVHRDLKPANVLLSASGEPVLIDFGIAQVLDATRLTMTGTFLGTPGYAAPELFADEPVGEPADVHAWAATVAFAATGRPTFGRGTVEAQMYAILNGQADLAGVPAALLPLIRAALHREAAKRPTAALLSARLSRLARASFADPASAGAPEPSARAIGSRRESRRQPGAQRSGQEKAGPERAGSERAGSAPVGSESRMRTALRNGGAPRGARSATGENMKPGRRFPVAERAVPGTGRGRQADGSPAAEAVAVSPAGTLPAGNLTLIVLAVLAVPCVVTSVIWPPATFAVTAVFVVLTRAVWTGHWLVRRHRSAGVRRALRVLGFPLALAGSLLTAAVWPGAPAAGLAGLTLWLAMGGSLPPEWWLQPAPVPVAVAGVVFGVVCGWITGREVERAGSRLPELRREGLRAMVVLGGFAAVCTAAVRVVALVL
ncbi:protein kinase [Planomonospora sp. ID91781]|uniref:Serine/threonine protein kinase n=1 Tax=Planomonospora sphaerica TaxID=161355 RepID=A0A171DGV2_9ACTN|nr:MULTISPECIES: serine/threonine-protein kinase [Planomonospora]MBG0824775.1 protein kinase [Planomonospora sp. ID91781]GAT68409.1 serine/threonine protein kinase [Planomonospora sphaerica]